MATTTISAPAPATVSLPGQVGGSPAPAVPQAVANAWLRSSLLKDCDVNGDGKLSFKEFKQGRSSSNISPANQSKLALIDQATFDAIDQADDTTDGRVDLRVGTADRYLGNQVAQYGTPKASEYLLAAATAGGLVADPSAPTEAEKATLSALQDKLAQGGLGSLSSEEQAVVVRAGALMSATEWVTTDPEQTLETLTKRLRYELGYEQTQPNVDPANFDSQSLLARGSDADRLNLFLYNSVANHYKTALGLTSKTDQSVPGFSFMLESEAPDVPWTKGGEIENWRPSYLVLTPEQTQVVNDWVAANGPITDQNKAEVCAALAQKFPQPGWHFTAKSFPDVWVGQRENIGVLQQAQDQAYREWNPDGTPKFSSPEHMAAQLGQQLHLNYGPDGQPELDFQPNRLAATDREAQAAPATIHDRGQWVWNDPANPPTKTILHEPAQSAMGPTGKGREEVVTDDTKIGDLSCGHWEYTPREGATAIPNTSEWFKSFTETLFQSEYLSRSLSSALDLLREQFDDVANPGAAGIDQIITRADLEAAVTRGGDLGHAAYILIEHFDDLDTSSSLGSPDGGFSVIDLEVFSARQASQFNPTENPLSMGSALVILRTFFEGASRSDGNEELDLADLDKIATDETLPPFMRYAADYARSHFNELLESSRNRYDFDATEAYQYGTTQDIDLPLQVKQFLNQYIVDHGLDMGNADHRDELEQAYREYYSPSESSRSGVHLRVSRLNEGAAGVPMDNLEAVLAEVYGIDHDRQIAPLHNITQDNGWLGLGFGANGNCASVAAIKLAWAFFGGNAEQVFEKLERRPDGGLTATLKDGTVVEVAQEEWQQAANVSDWDGEPLAIDSAEVLWAVAIKNASNRTGVDYYDMLEDMKNGFLGEDVLRDLGLRDFMVTVANPSDEQIRALPFAIPAGDGHQFYSSFGAYDKWGNTKPIEDWGDIDYVTYLRFPR